MSLYRLDITKLKRVDQYVCTGVRSWRDIGCLDYITLCLDVCAYTSVSGILTIPEVPTAEGANRESHARYVMRTRRRRDNTHYKYTYLQVAQNPCSR